MDGSYAHAQTRRRSRKVAAGGRLGSGLDDDDVFTSAAVAAMTSRETDRLRATEPEGARTTTGLVQA